MSLKRRAPGGGKTRRLSREQLEIWLDNLDPPAAGVSKIDGYLAALAVSPRLIEPELWMRGILGDRVRNVVEGTRMAAARDTIIDRYHQICFELAHCPEAFAPVYMRTDEGEVLLEDWAGGFFGGMRLALDAWDPFLRDPETGHLLTILIGHSTPDGGPTWIEELNNPEATEMMADAWRIVPDIVSLLHERCSEARYASMS